MLGIWSKESRIKKRAEEALSKTRSLLEDHSRDIESRELSLLREKINQTESALSDGNTNEVLRRTEELEEVSKDHLSEHGKSKLRQNLEALLIAVALALLIRTFVVQPFKIPSGSMIPTLLVGDHLLVYKFIYGTRIPFTDITVLPFRDIQRGDIVVFTYPNPEQNPSMEDVYYIKRVVGLPGDRINIEGRNLVINGDKVELEHSGTYHSERTNEIFDEYVESLNGNQHRAIYQQGKPSTDKGNLPLTVPESMYFVMGDNRDNSRDSRFWEFVPKENIAGKAFIIHWSWDWDDPQLLDKVRWERLLEPID